jgi:hypothetical protein
MDAAVSEDIASGIAVRLAGEGVPFRVISRATKISFDELLDQLAMARAAGRIMRIPREDWPVLPRGHSSEPARLRKFDEDTLLSATMRIFGLTLCQARIMLTLIRLPGSVSNERLHDAYNQRGNDTADTALKIVDVVICTMRKKLEPLGLTIVSEWGYGKRLRSADRARALQMLLDELDADS